MTDRRIWMLSPVAEADRDFFLAQLRIQADQAPDPDRLRSIAVFQSRDPAGADTLAAASRAILPGSSVLHQDESAVSRARNRALAACLERADPADVIVFRDCRSVLDRQFLQSLLDRPEPVEVFKAARMIWSTTLPPPSEGRARATPHHDLIGYPTVGRFAFSPGTLERVRFPEDLGPGAETVVKSGEDVLFMADLLRSREDWTVTELPGTLVLAPRQDTHAKRRSYAAGQVHVARLLAADRRLPGRVRRLARLRLWLFTLGTIRFMRPGTMDLFHARLSALLMPPPPRRRE